MSAHFDVIVVGGGPAGLSAAGVHDLLGQEGTAPRELVTDDDLVGFRLALASGEVIATRSVGRHQRRQRLLLRGWIQDRLHRTPASMAGRLSDIIERRSDGRQFQR